MAVMSLISCRPLKTTWELGERKKHLERKPTRQRLLFFILRFFSNYFESGMGFQLEYESSNVFQGMINRFDECGGYFSNTNGTITSPSYPGNYPDNADCIYTIAQPIGTVILLNFLSIDIQICTYSWCNPCIFDYLEIRDGPSADSFLLDKLCGSESPAPIQSNQNQLWMKWVEISLAKCLSEIKSIIWFISDSTPMAIRIERDFT